MSRSAPRLSRLSRRRSVAVLLFAISLTAVSAAVALAVTKGNAPQLQVARGVVNGSYHPIAGKFTPDKTKLADCHQGDFRCFEQAFGNLAYANGPRSTLALFDQRRAVDKTVGADCHRIAHMIGSAALAYFRGNIAQAYSHGSASCASGYFHGILERAFVGVRSYAGLIHVARTLCRGAGVRRRGFLDYQCTHGLGHGLMIQTGYDLPTALAVCARLQTRWDEVSCAGGVFMENGSTVYGLRSKWLKDDDPIYPCRTVPVRDRASCYTRVTTQILRTNHFNWVHTAARCRAVQARWRLYCFRSYGRDAADSAIDNRTEIERLCYLATPEARQCFYGAARVLADRFADTREATALCTGARPRERPGCFVGLGVVVGLLEPNNARRRAACARAAGPYERNCFSGAAGEVAPDGRGAWG